MTVLSEGETDTQTHTDTDTHTDSHTHTHTQTHTKTHTLPYRFAESDNAFDALLARHAPVCTSGRRHALLRDPAAVHKDHLADGAVMHGG